MTVKMYSLRKLAQRRKDNKPIMGVLDANPRIDDKPNWLRVLLYNGHMVEAYNRDLPPVPGLPVILRRSEFGGRLEIVAARDVYAVDASYPYIKAHGISHDYFSSDPVYISLRQIKPLQVSADGLKLTIQAGIFLDADGKPVHYAGGTVDLSTYTITGLANWFLLTIDDSGTLTVTQGPEASATNLIPSEIPSPPANSYPIAAVRLVAGAERLRDEERMEYSDIIDLRFINLPASGGASGDMTKAVYDTDDDGVVDKAEGLVETGGPTALAMGAVANGQYLKRDGNAIVGASLSNTMTVARARQTTRQTLGTNEVRINFNTVEEDPDSAITTGANWVFTAPAAGLYIFNVSIGAATAYGLTGRIYLNGSPITSAPYFSMPRVVTGPNVLTIGYSLILATGDEIYFTVGTTVNDINSYRDTTHFNVAYIRQ